MALLTYGVQGVLPLANNVHVDARGSVDALFVQGSDQSQVVGVGRERDGAVEFLQPELDVPLRSRVAKHPQNTHGITDRQIFADEEVRGGGTVLQETSRVTDHWAVNRKIQQIVAGCAYSLGPWQW